MIAAEIMMPPILVAVFRTSAAPHRDRRGRQAPHLKQITAGHVSGGRIAGDEARDFAVHDIPRGGIGVSARLEKERHIPDVMQPERNERAFDHAVNGEGERRLLVHRPM